MGLPIELSEVHCAESYVVTDNEGGTDEDDPVELSYGIARWCHPSRFEDGKQWF